MTGEILFAQNLGALSGVVHGFFTGSWEKQRFSEVNPSQEAIEARKRIAAWFGVSVERLLFCRQIHSPNVVNVRDDVWTSQNALEADAMVTDKPGIVLGILTADCVPVLLASPNLPVIGAVHAGWRGALGGVLENTVAAMEELGAERKSIRAAAGPCIWQESYEVGSEFPAPFLAEDPENKMFFTPSVNNGHYQFDLPGYVSTKLRNLGVKSVEPSPADTCADPARFFSHRYSTLRGEKRKGSLVSAICTNAERPLR
jgi:YfiH family protein